MLDIKRIREDYEGVKERVEYRGKGDFGIGDVKKYDEERRALLANEDRENEALNELISSISEENGAVR